MKATIQTVGEYKAPPELARQLKAFEASIKQAFEDTENTRSGRLNPTAIRRAEYTAKFEELVLCDPSDAGFAVNLPDARKADAGRDVVVKNTTGSTNTITVRTGGSLLVDGSGTWQMSTALQAKRFVWDGTAWWSL